jgi:hypothetical protein
MLANANKEDWHIRCVDHADQSSNHISDSITFGDDESIKGSATSKRCIEISCLGDRVCSNQSLWTLAERNKKQAGSIYFSNHKDFIRIGKFGELLEGRHETLNMVSEMSKVKAAGKLPGHYDGGRRYQSRRRRILSELPQLWHPLQHWQHPFHTPFRIIRPLLPLWP